jgi:hypothetical protein
VAILLAIPSRVRLSFSHLVLRANNNNSRNGLIINMDRSIDVGATFFGVVTSRIASLNPHHISITEILACQISILPIPLPLGYPRKRDTKTFSSQITNKI